MPESDAQQNEPKKHAPIDSLRDADAIITTLAVMTVGILISILGVAAFDGPFNRVAGGIMLGLGITLIVGQYVGMTRRNRFCLAFVNGILAAMTLIFLLLVFAFPPLFLAFFAVTATLLIMNWYHRAVMLDQEQAGVPKPASTRITLQELLGAFVVLALILGPAKIISRLMGH